ncbi:CBS and ACT domain-containing protein [Bacillus pinisoli]|uniref:CBS and ACT domain-containing protein n=1 Tax=Bacillus pinisoli TaxID=2901866 RepID=UPI001FF3FC18|nr:CBS and ACT domain-containing protein [Bacillus pinisoli]
MIVDEIMKKKVITLLSTDTIRKAKLLMLENGIRHLPVVNDQQQVIGLVTRSDLYQYFLTSGDEEDRAVIADVMNTKVITGHPLDFIEEVAAICFERKIGCLPITENNKLVGIVTETDLLHTFVQLTGADQPGSQIEIKTSTISDVLAEVTTVTRELHLNILSVIVYPTTNAEKQTLVLRIQTKNPLPLIEKLRAKQYDVLWPRLPGATYE